MTGLATGLSPILAAKTMPPPMQAMTLRADQIARVADAATARLVLVRAPAGYGKTALVAASARDLEWRHVWYRLDSLDASPKEFFHSLLEAVRHQRPGLREAIPEPRSQTERAASPCETAAQFITQLGRTNDESLHIILDDYDSVAPCEELDASLTSLSRLLPTTIHLVVLCRRRPTFATTKLELDGDLTQLTWADLALDREQIAQTVELRGGVAPTVEAVEELLTVTEGWAAAVVLAAKAAGASSPGGHGPALIGCGVEREVFAFFSDQVYERQPDDVRQFLKRTSCLGTISARLAEAVTGLPTAHSLLEHVHANEVFTFSTASGDAVRYHPLFQRFLQARVRRDEGEVAYRKLQQQSADALAAGGLLASAVNLYLALGDTQRPLALLESHGMALLDECSESLLQQWAVSVSVPSAVGSDWVGLLEGRRLSHHGRVAAAREQLELAHETLKASPAGHHMVHRALARHSYVTGADEEAIEHARASVSTASDPCQAAESLAALARTLCVACRWVEFDEALSTLEALRDSRRRPATEVAYLETQRAYMTGDVRDAVAIAERALSLAQREGTHEQVGGLLNALANLSFYHGTYSRSGRYLAQAQRERSTYALGKTAAELEVLRAALLAQDGKPDAALSVLDGLLSDGDSRDNAALQFEIESLRGTVLRRDGRRTDAAEAYERALRIVGPSGPPYDRLSVALDLAFTRHLCGDGRRAAPRIRQLMDEALRQQLMFHCAKATFYSGVIALSGDHRAVADLGSACEELVRLGHLDFLGQELAVDAVAARALVTSDIEEGSLNGALGAIACQSGAPSLLAPLAAVSDRVALLIVEAARKRLSAEQRRSMLAQLRRHPSKRVRDGARRTLLGGDEGRLFPELTPREEEIIALLAEGCTNRQIAERLSLTVSTVKTHVHRILARMDAHGRLTVAVLYKQRAASSLGPAAITSPGESPGGAPDAEG